MITILVSAHLSHVGPKLRGTANRRLPDWYAGGGRAVAYGHWSQKPSTPPLSVKYQHSLGARASPAHAEADLPLTYPSATPAAMAPPRGHQYEDDQALSSLEGPRCAQSRNRTALGSRPGASTIIGDLSNARSGTVLAVRGALATGMQAPARMTATVKVPQTHHPRMQYCALMAASIAVIQRGLVRHLQKEAGGLLRVSGRDASRAVRITQRRFASQ